MAFDWFTTAAVSLNDCSSIFSLNIVAGLAVLLLISTRCFLRSTLLFFCLVPAASLFLQRTRSSFFLASLPAQIVALLILESMRDYHCFIILAPACAVLSAVSVYNRPSDATFSAIVASLIYFVVFLFRFGQLTEAITAHFLALFYLVEAIASVSASNILHSSNKQD